MFLTHEDYQRIINGIDDPSAHHLGVDDSSDAVQDMVFLTAKFLIEMVYQNW